MVMKSLLHNNQYPFKHSHTSVRIDRVSRFGNLALYDARRTCRMCEVRKPHLCFSYDKQQCTFSVIIGTMSQYATQDFQFMSDLIPLPNVLSLIYKLHT